jgi:hypothetical protein
MSRSRSNILTKFSDDEKKAIPSKVFFNHFYAIYYNIINNEDRFLLKKNPFFNELKIKNETFELEKCRKLLWNSWSTEYAFNLASKVENEDYYKYSFHWNFPQAYYSIYLAMTAFHETQGIANDKHEKSIKIFGNSVKDKHYPTAISFYTKGLHNEFEYINLPLFKSFPEGYSALAKIKNKEEAQLQIASFLKSTRIKNAKNKRIRAKTSNDRRFHNKKGIFTKAFRKNHWDLIYKTIPETTILNIIYRLRIKANYHDVETFVNADIDFKLFHECLAEIVYYLNFVHEAYVYKAIGKKAYEKILIDFNGHMDETKSKERFSRLILKT